MSPSGVVLARTYAFGEDLEIKGADWGERLWLVLKRLLPLSPPRSLRGSDGYDFLTDRLTNYVHTRLIIRGVQLVDEFALLPTEDLDQGLGELVEDLLDVSPQERDEIVWLLRRACERINAGGAEPNRTQRKRIRRFASANKHRCYLCGHSLHHGDEAQLELAHEEDAPKKEFERADSWFFEIEHVFPAARGGSRHRMNLAASCKSCNKFKDVMISFADLPVESYVTGSLRPAQVKSDFGGIKKFALLWRQKGCCARCDTPFHDATDERLFIVRGDPDDAYHFFNVQIACGPCGEQVEGGVMLRE